MNNIPVNSDDPYFLASEVFRDTLLGFGVDEDGANNAKNLFLAIKKDKIEETSNLIFRIASKLDMESSQLCELKIQDEFSFRPDTFDGQQSFPEGDDISLSSKQSKSIQFNLKSIDSKLSDKLSMPKSSFEKLSKEKVKKSKFQLEDLLPQIVHESNDLSKKQMEKLGLKAPS